MPRNPELQRRLESIEELLRKIEAAADPSLRAQVQELMQLVMNLHGAGMERMLELIHATGEPGEMLIERLGRDELTGSLLILHGLHPLDLEARVSQAIERVRANAELLSVQDGAVRVRLHAHGQKEKVEKAVYDAAPDLTSLTIEDVDEKQGFVPLEMLLNGYKAPLAMKGAL
jgi:hypothetical protein